MLVHPDVVEIIKARTVYKSLRGQFIEALVDTLQNERGNKDVKYTVGQFLNWSQIAINDVELTNDVLSVLRRKDLIGE